MTMSTRRSQNDYARERTVKKTRLNCGSLTPASVATPGVNQQIALSERTFVDRRRIGTPQGRIVRRPVLPIARLPLGPWEGLLSCHQTGSRQRPSIQALPAYRIQKRLW
jgi:hypothetical protein